MAYGLAAFVGVFAIVAGFQMVDAFRWGERKQGFRMLRIALPCAVITVAALWVGPKTFGALPPDDAGLGPGWHCANIPWARACTRSIP